MPYRGFCRILIIVCATVLALLFGATLVAADIPTGYQEYYVLGNEEHTWRAFLDIYDGSDDDIPGNICSTVSLVATANHQVVYYDHWEDGYEADPLHPVQTTTEIYTLTVGATLLLSSTEITGPTINRYITVTLGRDPAYIRYDSGDRIITSGGPVALAHAIWPFGRPWVGGAWEIYSRQAYAGMYSYNVPIGEDLYTMGGGDDGIFGDFRDVYASLSAYENNTTISIDNGTGTKVNLTLDRGQAYSSMGYINSSSAPSITINAGTTIHTNKPLQVGLITGADGIGGFQGRFFVLLPDQQWGADYVIPVPAGYSTTLDPNRSVPAEIYLFNPNNFPITINAYDAETQTTFLLNASSETGATVPYSQKRGGYVPQDSAARFTSSDGIFGAVVAADTSEMSYDWGFSGIPTKYLTEDYYVSWAPGTTDLSANGSPVWVTPVADETTFFVDFSPLDGTVDVTFTLNALEQYKIFDLNDNDNTGMHIWATGKFAVSWGADPSTAGGSSPFIDLGISVLPLQQRWLSTVLTLDLSAEPVILPLEGGIVTFTLVSQAYQAPVVGVDITHTLPVSWTYVPGSTNIVYPMGQTTQPDPTINGQNLYWDLSADLQPNESFTLTFQAETHTATSATANVNYAQAIGKHQFSNAYFNPRDEITVYLSPLNLIKSVDKSSVEIGQTLVYTLAYENRTEAVTTTHVAIQDVMPIQHVTLESISAGGVYHPASSTIIWEKGTLFPGQSSHVTFTVRVNNFVEDGTLIENVGYITSDQTIRINSNSTKTLVNAPKLTFTKSGPTGANQGDIITYTLHYANLSKTEATNIVISDTIPISTTYVPCSLAIMTTTTWLPLSDAPGDDHGAYISPTLIVTPGTVAPGQYGEVRYSVRIHDPLPTGSLILNTATIDRDLDIPRDSNLIVTRIIDLLIQKQAQPEIIMPGEIITYTLIYENTSTTLSHTDVFIQDAVPDYTDFVPGSATGGDQITYSWDHGKTWSATLPVTPVTDIRWYDAALSPGTEVSLNFTVKAKSPLPERTTIENIAYISSTQTSAYMREWLPSNLAQVQTMDLWIQKSINSSSANAGDIVSYTLTYGNYGSANVSDAQIVDIVPGDMTYKAGSIWGTGANASAAPNLIWDVGMIPANSSAQQVGYAAILNSGLAPSTLVTNTATINTDAIPHSSNSATLTIATAADLLLTKFDSIDPVSPNTTLTYTIIYTNAGPSDAQDVTLVDNLPAGLTFGGMTKMAPLFGPTSVGQLVTWYTPTLPASTSNRLVFTVSVGAEVGRTFINTATLTSLTPDPDTNNNIATETTTVTHYINLAITKSCTPGIVLPGELLTYTLSFTNNGTANAPDFTITDVVPAQVTIQNITSSGVSIAEIHPAPDLVLYGTDLGPGESGLITLTGIISTGLPVGLRLTNTVTITNSGGEITPDDNHSAITVVIANAAPIAGSDAINVLEGNTATTLVEDETTVLHNDYDPNGGALWLNTTPIITALYGKVTLNADGTFSYTHDGSENRDDSFAYQICDDEVPQLCNTGIVSVTVAPVNDMPVAQDDVINVRKGDTATRLASGATTVLANDTDPDLPPDTLTTTLVSDVLHGELTFSADGTFLYSHDNSDNYSDSFAYRVCDNGTPNLCDLGTVAINIITINRAPVANEDTIIVDEGGTVNQLNSGDDSVLYNDTDPDLPFDTLTVTLITDVAYGTLTLNANGTFTYTHDGSEHHNDSFGYQACDNGAPQLCDTATVFITISPINDPPILSSIADINAYINTALLERTFTVRDEDNAPADLTLTAFSSNSALIPPGAIELNGDNITRTIRLIPTADMTGTTMITLTASDGEATAATTFIVTISERPIFHIYLPLILKEIPGPDLVVQDLIVSANDIQVVIKNQGKDPVPSQFYGFYIDVYINPITVPTQVNQTWDKVGDQGLVWAVNRDLLPFNPGQTLTLQINDPRYYPGWSNVQWPLEPGIWIYAQVDSANTTTTYGSVLESHEMVGAPYNNIIGIQFTGTEAQPPAQSPVPAIKPGRETPPSDMPPRP